MSRASRNPAPLKLAFSVLLVTLLAACNERPGHDAAASFEAAGRQFLASENERDYLKAAQQYQALLDQGFESGALWFNLGNCFLKAGHSGRALAAYRQAQRFRPRDPYLAANLTQALTDRARLEEDQRALLEHILFWQRWLSTPQKAWLTLALATLAFLLAVTNLLISGRARGLLLRGAWLVILLSGVAGFSYAVDVYDQEFVEHGVLTEAVVARKGASETYEPAFTEALEEGVEFDVVRRQGEWLLIELSSDLTGWVPAERAQTY